VDANAAATLDPQELVTKLKAENEAQVKAIAEKDEELAQMRKQLAKFEAVPP
jgi:predicted  nucleic acid-binding Zn-ribbon protein